jgi:hypothetical protein
MDVQRVVAELLQSETPSIRYKIRVNVLGEDPASKAIGSLQAEIRRSALVATLLAHRDVRGRIAEPRSVYAKWQGAHWIMAALADIGYPAGDSSLVAVRDQLLAHWLAPRFYAEFTAKAKAAAYGRVGVPIMQGRPRRCASQQANALWSILRLGLVNDQSHELVERLLHWQWPDGGWNCDKDPAACHSSFMESIIPIRALALYGKLMNDPPALQASARGVEIFLKRRLFLRARDGATMRKEFTLLHYPLYWHYDILHGLKVMAEVGFINDPRCAEALELLLSKRLPDGGWPAERKYYKPSRAIKQGYDYVDWGPSSSRKMNPWVTADALFVLRAAGLI